MHTTLATIVLATLSTAATAAPIRVVDLTGGSPGLPVAAALAYLGERVAVAPAGVSPSLADTDVLILDGASDLTRLAVQPGALAEFVGHGGGVLVAGLPDSLPRTASLLGLLGAAAPARVPDAELFSDDSGDWLWTGTQPGETADHTRYVRKAFDVTRPVKRALVRCTVDNLYTVFLNGDKVGEHWSWYDHELWDIAAELHQGRNVLAFQARNVDGPGGLYAQIGVEYQDGSRELIVSDPTWKFRAVQEPNWAALEHDDSAWRPATDILPMVQYTHIFDRSRTAAGPLTLHGPHPILNAITDRLGTSHTLRGVVPQPGTQVLISAGEDPVMLCAGHGRGRVVLMDAVTQPGGLGLSDLGDDLLATSLLWLAHRPEPVTIAAPVYPPQVIKRGAGVRIAYTLPQVTSAVDGEFTATMTHNGLATPIGHYTLRAGEPLTIAWSSDETRDAGADGAWDLDLTAQDAAGLTVFRRTLSCQVANPLTIPSNRHVVAQGMTVRFTGDLTGLIPSGARLTSAIVDPWGRKLPAPEPEVTGGNFTWTYPVPDLAEGDYRLVVSVNTGDELLDSFGVPFTVVPRLDLADFFPTTMRMSEFTALDKAGMERDIEDIVDHGFNTLTFSGHRLGSAPGSPYDYAEDYAQRRGMAVSYSFQGDFCLLTRDGLPPVSVFSPEYRDAIRPRIEAVVETCRQVPRLLNVQGYMDEPFQTGGDTFDARQPAREEFRRRYGVEMPTREDAARDPTLWLKYVDFWSDCFAAGWRQSYEMVKALDPDFWVELTHDSHSTFGAAGGHFVDNWAVDDPYHWGAPFDSVNYDIYPYLSIDFRSGKFHQTPLPRMAGMHMAFSQVRNVAYSYDKHLGFWVESGWSELLAPGAPGRQYPWSPRELTYTALAAGCDYLNTFWGIPQDPQWWETFRGTMREVKALAPLLTRSRVPRARAAYVFPRTQHVLLQEEYWNVMVALEAFRQAYGELDCIHEEQLCQGALDGRDVLVLFDVHLLPRREAGIIRDWVHAGGRLIADEVPSLDERKQPLGLFEPLFGVTGSEAVQEDSAGKLWGRRGYEAAGATVVSRSGEVPLVLSSAAGAGQTFLLNFPLKDCYLDALAQASPVAGELLGILRQATGDRPGNVTCSNPGIEVGLRLTHQGTGLLLLINHESRDEIARVTLPHLPAGAVVRDLIAGERLPAGPGYSLELRCPWGQTRALGIFPSDPSGLALEGLEASYAPGDPVGYALVVGGDQVRGNYLLDVSVAGPDDHVYQAFSALTCTLDGTCERSFRLPLNAQPGNWTVKATSLWDGATAEGHFVVR